MKNTMRKMISMALVVVMLACAIPFSAFAFSTLAEALEAQKAAEKTVEQKQDALDQTKIEVGIAGQAVDAAQKAVNDAKAIEASALSAYEAAKSTDGEAAAKTAWEAAKTATTNAQTALDNAKYTLRLKTTAFQNAEVDLASAKRYLTECNNEVTRLKNAEGASNGNIIVNVPGSSTSASGSGSSSSNGGVTVVLPGSGNSSNSGSSNNGGISNIVIGSGSTSGTTGGTIINGGSNTGSNTGSNNNTSGGIWLGNNNTVVNKDPYPVYLNIYVNGNVSTIAKKVDITKGIAADGYVDLEDVKNVVKSYFNAKDSDGILYDGLYIFDGSFGGQYTTDVGRVDGYGNINEDRKLSTVNINVMIKNAVAKGSVAADTSNPKTGDMIFLTVTALVASAGALALVYANKKRFLVK